MYKGLKGKARIPTDDLIPKNRRSLPLGAWDGLRYFIVALPEPSIILCCRNQHSMVFQIPSAGKDSYKKKLLSPNNQGLECPP